MTLVSWITSPKDSLSVGIKPNEYENEYEKGISNNQHHVFRGMCA